LPKQVFASENYARAERLSRPPPDLTSAMDGAEAFGVAAGCKGVKHNISSDWWASTMTTCCFRSHFSRVADRLPLAHSCARFSQFDVHEHFAGKPWLDPTSTPLYNRRPYVDPKKAGSVTDSHWDDGWPPLLPLAGFNATALGKQIAAGAPWRPFLLPDCNENAHR